MYTRGSLGEFLSKENRHELVGILSEKVFIEGKNYPISRAISKTIQSLSSYIKNESNALKLPILGDYNGEIYESDSDV